MNGLVRKEYIQRLSRNLSNQELGLRQDEEYSSSSYGGGGGGSSTQRDRDALVQTKYRKKYNQTLKAVQKSTSSTTTEDVYTMKRRKFAPSLQRQKNNKFRVVSPYFPIEEEEEEEEEEMNSSYSTTINSNNKRSLGRKAASRYPRYGLLDLCSSSTTTIGLDLGQNSFEVKGITDLREKEKGIPREDGFLKDDDPEDPYGEEWQTREFTRQKLLEKDPNYRFIVSLSGNVSSSSVTKLYDEDQLENMILRRMNIRRQMQRMHQIDTSRVQKGLAELKRLELALENIDAVMNVVDGNQVVILRAKNTLDLIFQSQVEISTAMQSISTLNTARGLLFEVQKFLKHDDWMNKLDKLEIGNATTMIKIQRCTDFLFGITKDTSGEIEASIQVASSAGIGMKGDTRKAFALRALFICLSYFVASILKRLELRLRENRGDFKAIKSLGEGRTSSSSTVPSSGKQTVMKRWVDLMNTNDGILSYPKPTWYLESGDDYSDQLGSLRNIWIMYWDPEKVKEEGAPKVTGMTDEIRKQIGDEFLLWLNELQAKIDGSLQAQVLEQEAARGIARRIQDDRFPKHDRSLNDWENDLREWVEAMERASELSRHQRRNLRNKIQAAREAMEDMEILQPARVKYKHRKGWALSPEHSGHVPLAATVVAGIEAAIDVMRDVKNELTGTRADHILNVLQAGADQLQKSSLSRAAFAKLVASRMALQEEYFSSTWTRKEQMGRIRMLAASALLSLSNLRWTGSKIVDRRASASFINRILGQPTTSIWSTPAHLRDRTPW